VTPFFYPLRLAFRVQFDDCYILCSMAENGKNNSFFFQFREFFPSISLLLLALLLLLLLSSFLFLSSSLSLYLFLKRRISELLLLANGHTNVDVYFEVYGMRCSSVWKVSCNLVLDFSFDVSLAFILYSPEDEFSSIFLLASQTLDTTTYALIQLGPPI